MSQGKLEDYFYLGYINAAHGIRGAVKARLDVKDINEYRSLGSVFLFLNDEVREKVVHRLKPTGRDEVILELEEISDRDAAENLKGAQIYLPIEQLPPLNSGQFYYHDIIGFQVVDKKKGKVGIVKAIQAFPAQDILIVAIGEQEAMLPITDEFVLSAESETKCLHVSIPEGLLEVYLDDSTKEV